MEAGNGWGKARYMNGVGFEILACTPVPQLPLSFRKDSLNKQKIIYFFFRSSVITDNDQS